MTESGLSGSSQSKPNVSSTCQVKVFISFQRSHLLNIFHFVETCHLNVFISSLLRSFQINFKGGIDLRAKLQEHTLHFKSGLLEFTRKGSGYWKLDLPSLVCDVPGECEALCNLTRYECAATIGMVLRVVSHRK